MGTKIKKCRYVNCLHTTREIDIENEEYKVEGQAYFHPDCYKLKKDIIYIRNLWIERINENVIVKHLYKVINDFIFKDNIPSDYLVFLITYCSKSQKLRLRHPQGIKYYLDNYEIKTAYKKSKIDAIKKSEFKITTKSENDEPHFSIKKTEIRGFDDIFGRKK